MISVPQPRPKVDLPGLRPPRAAVAPAPERGARGTGDGAWEKQSLLRGLIQGEALTRDRWVHLTLLAPPRYRIPIEIAVLAVSMMNLIASAALLIVSAKPLIPLMSAWMSLTILLKSADFCSILDK